MYFFFHLFLFFFFKFSFFLFVSNTNVLIAAKLYLEFSTNSAIFSIFIIYFLVIFNLNFTTMQCCHECKPMKARYVTLPLYYDHAQSQSVFWKFYFCTLAFQIAVFQLQYQQVEPQIKLLCVKILGQSVPYVTVACTLCFPQPTSQILILFAWIFNFPHSLLYQTGHSDAAKITGKTLALCNTKGIKLNFF